MVKRTTRIFSLNTIGGKLALAMLAISLLVLVQVTSSYYLNTQVKAETASVSIIDIPIALSAINMLDELGDMNSNILEYTLGEPEERDDFEVNRRAFRDYLTQLEAADNASVAKGFPPNPRIVEIVNLFNEYQSRARAEVLNIYSPEQENWARQRLASLIQYTGAQLESLVEQLKESELTDAGSASETGGQDRYNELLQDDLPGVQYYLEIRDEVGDMLSSLASYVDGDTASKMVFSSSAQNFEYFFTKLQPLEQKSNEIKSLAEVKALYLVLRDGGGEIFERYNSANKKQAIKAIDTLEHQVFSRLETLLDNLALAADAKSRLSLDNLSSLTQSNQYFLSISLALVLGGCFAIILFAHRTISLPISILNHTMRELAQGNTQINVTSQNRNDEVGDMAQSVEVFKLNIIDRDRVEQELVNARDIANAASQAKANFLATMSHEIRTPMNGIIGMIDLLMTTQMNREQQSMSKTIRDSSFSLLNIINDILDFSKVEAGKLELEEIEFSLMEVVEGVVDTLVPGAEAKNVKLQLYTDPLIPRMLIGDPVRLRQVLFNLLGNAVKFSGGIERKGLVDVTIKVSPNHDDSRVHLNVAIRDNGIGIKSEEIEYLFRPFTQAESSTTRRFGGTGLGLAICQNLVHLMQGNIRVESKVNEGSTFYLQLSFASIGQALSVGTNFNDVCVFNFIKNSWLSRYVPEYLQSSDVELIDSTFTEMAEHLSTSNSQYYIVVTDDYEECMTKIDKYVPASLALRLRYLVLRLNARGEGIISEQAFAIGARPLKHSTLIHGINVVIGKESPAEIFQDTSFELSTAVLSVEEAEAAGQLILVAEDNQTNQEVIKKQLRKIGFTCLIADDGISAESLYDKHQFSLVLTDCHMPHRDGYELARILKIKQRRDGRDVPIVAITANALLGEAEKCLAAGMNDYLAKPIELIKLKNMVHKWLKIRHASNRALPELITAEQITNLDVNLANGVNNDGQQNVVLNTQVITDIFAGDEDDYLDSLADFLQLSLPQLTLMAKMHSETLDLSIMKGLAHKLKSSAATMGVTRVAELCRQVENQALAGQVNEVVTLLQQLEQVLPLVIDSVNKKLLHRSAY